MFLTMCKNYCVHSILARIYIFVKAYDTCQRTEMKSLNNETFHPIIPVEYSPMKSYQLTKNLCPKVVMLSKIG